MRRYSDTMSEAEAAALLAEVDALDAVYAEVDAQQAEARRLFGEAGEDEQSLDYFNRYIAGDRR